MTKTIIKNWLPAILAALLGLALALGVVGPLAKARAQPPDAVAYFGTYTTLPFTGYLYPDSYTVHWNSNRQTVTVSVTWWLEGQALRDVVEAGGYYIEPVVVQINQQQRVNNAVVECSIKGRCTLRASAAYADGTLFNCADGPYVEDRKF